MGLSLSKRGQGTVPIDSVASTPDTICSKEDQDAGQGMITRLEMDIAEEHTNSPYRQNLQVCLDWIKKYGYPTPSYEIWAFDGIVRCQKKDEAREFRNTIPDYSDRNHECARVVSSLYQRETGQDSILTFEL